MYKGVNPERKLLMDLKVYAISQKLKNENSELIKYVNNDNIPRDIIEKEFKEVFENYQDDKAELLADDYRQYLLGTTQVMFSKNSSGLNIEGELKDNVVDIIETIHKTSKEENQPIYIGDNSKVIQVVSELPFPKGMKYDSIEIQSKTEPYELKVFVNYNENKTEGLKQCADKAFKKISNMGVISFYNKADGSLIESFNKE